MNVEITRGRSDIYDNTFDFIESHKIRNGFIDDWEVSRDWMKLQYAVSKIKNLL
jgi:hypothetical protein